jgi:hypothetical protein
MVRLTGLNRFASEEPLPVVARQARARLAALLTAAGCGWAIARRLAEYW